jgi:predicted Zn-dependent peptidase
MKINYSIHKVNGYTVILVPNDTNTVRINACIKTGSLNETKHDAGIHHLVEHILTESWKPCGKDTCNSYWDKHGALVNASTDDIMKYYIKGNKKDIPDMVDYISSIITRSLFFPTTLEREKKAVLEELTNLADNPSQKIYNVFHKAFLGVGHINIYAFGYSCGFAVIVYVIGLYVFNRVEKTFMDTI